MTQDEEHELRNYLAKLQLKAQLLGKAPLEALNLRDTQEKIAVGYLAALRQMSDTMDRWERERHAEIPGPLAKLRERIKRWLSRSTS